MPLTCAEAKLGRKSCTLASVFLSGFEDHHIVATESMTLLMSMPTHFLLLALVGLASGFASWRGQTSVIVISAFRCMLCKGRSNILIRRTACPSYKFDWFITRAEATQLFANVNHLRQAPPKKALPEVNAAISKLVSERARFEMASTHA